MSAVLDDKIKTDEKELKIVSKDDDVYLTLKRKEFYSDKEKHQFIKNIERLIRSSKEYKEWIKFVKFTLGNDFCAFTQETDEETNDIEIHHHPFSLYDIVEMIIDTKLEKGEEFSSFEIAQEVLELHFKLKVGFIPLLRSLHKKYHNGYLKIPIELIHGDYKYLAKKYNLNERILASYNSKCSIKMKDIDDIEWKRNKYKIDDTKSEDANNTEEVKDEELHF